ncbi:MAG TPA: NUDIX domain-containing protein [Steroidobacteraceae bacterium]|nr:NUDIX domain-containing protein [Steroidobacteraceae bacterium]
MARNRTLTAEIKAVTTEYDGFLSIRRYEIEEDRHAGGRQRVVRFIMERGHAVAVLAYDPCKDQVVLVNELRPGMLAAGEAPFSDSLIAGAIDSGESAVEAAVREAREEAGLELVAPRVIIERAYVSPGGTSESITLVYGTVTAPLASEVYGNAAEMENIRTSILSCRRFANRLRRGEIKDMKTMLAGYWLIANRARLRREHATARVAPSVFAEP